LRRSTVPENERVAVVLDRENVVDFDVSGECRIIEVVTQIFRDGFQLPGFFQKLDAPVFHCVRCPCVSFAKHFNLSGFNVVPKVGAVFAEYLPINSLGFDFLECLLNCVQGIGSGILGEMAAKLMVMHCPFFRVFLW